MADDPREALARIRERVDAATEGPWWGGGSNRRRDSIGLVGRTTDRGTGNAIAVLNGVDMDRVADAEFIAHARTDVPRLVAFAEAVLDHADLVGGSFEATVQVAARKHLTEGANR